jgi:hypothetical protein
MLENWSGEIARNERHATESAFVRIAGRFGGLLVGCRPDRQNRLERFQRVRGGSNPLAPTNLQVAQPPGTNPPAKALFDMIDPIEDVLAPAVIERAIGIFESFRDRDRADIVQARKALTQHVFGLIGSGQTDDKQLVVSALAYLKSLEVRAEAAKP